MPKSVERLALRGVMVFFATLSAVTGRGMSLPLTASPLPPKKYRP